MAETNHTSSATNNDHERSPEDVTVIADNAAGAHPQGGQKMNMLAPIARPTRATNQPTNTTAALWRIALSEYHAEQAAYAIVAKEYETACGEYDAACEDGSAFADYGLDYGTERTREQLIRDTQVHVIARDYDTTVRALTPGQHGDVAKKAAHLVDDFVAWRERQKGNKERIYDAAEEKHGHAVSRLWDARDKVLLTPVPDVEALLYKLDVLAEDMRESHVQGDARVESLRDDALRLFGMSVEGVTAWEAALADYQEKRRASDRIPLGTEDEAVNSYAEAMDHLIEKVPAPNVAAVRVKFQLALERSEAGGFIDGFAVAILADLSRLAA